ncbi:hypothetical protein [Micromonospora sp. C41]|uniref:hypothetical protein n=1 Tax=Micromonospora sp. C41 TaxID=2824878 RepID=UPI001B35E8A6|nr:hypothetical protein [Micromonospora sp. C41]MBQ1061334.1 hypothetical protein [Micromonospora sp. C41]
MAVRITGREIYDAVVRLTGRVDVLIEQQQAIAQDVKDHEQRLRAVEARMWPLPAASLLVALAALAVGIIPKITN